MQDAGIQRRTRRRPRPLSWSNAASIAVSVSVTITSWLDPCAASPLLATHPPLHPGTIAVQHSQFQSARRLADDNVDATALLQAIGPIECPNGVGLTIRMFLEANKFVVDACSTETGYTIFPFSAKLPDGDQTSKVCASPNCMDMLSGVVLAKLPECEYQRYSVRSLAESFLRTRVDLQHGAHAPTATQFGQRYALNRVVNYLSENTSLQANIKSTTFKVSEVAARLNPAQINPDVVLSNGLVVMVNKTASTNTNATTTTTPTVAPPTLLVPANSSDLTTADLPENLQMAYIAIGVLWLLINALYYWLLTRKGSDNA